MIKRRLKTIRVAIALLLLVGLTAAFADFRGIVPVHFAHALASAQLIPSLLGIVAGTTTAAVFLGIVVVTLAIGRVYCAAICPLGVFQDVLAKVAKLLGRRQLLPYRPAMNWLRYSIFAGVLAGCALGWSGLVLTLLDPYSTYGRFASDLFRPVAAVLNNLMVPTANALGVQTLYRVGPQWASVGALCIPLLGLGLIAAYAFLRGRLYCNSICPVGTFLGILSKRAAFRLTIDQSACRKCAQCLRACPAQCIDLRSGTIDHSRCVSCFDCVAACDDNGIGYRFSWLRRAKPENEPPSTAKATPRQPVDPGRRAFISTGALALTAASGATLLIAASGEKTVHRDDDEKACRTVSPPGSRSIERFVTQCTGCHLCISACPTHVLRPALFDYGIAGLLKPYLDFHGAFCNFECRRCGEVCPDGAIDLLALADKQITSIGVATFHRERCIVVTQHTDCAACSEHCPTKAVDTAPDGNDLRVPRVNEKLCIGCGACEYACPVKPDKAITVAGRPVHERAEKKTEKPAIAPNPTNDFPF